MIGGVFNNISDLLTSIKMDLGIYGLALPLDNPDKAIMDCIKLRTLPTYSIYYPKQFTFKINTDDLQCLESGYLRSRYLLPTAMFPEQRILYILKVNPKSNLAGIGYATPIYNADISVYQGLMNTQVGADLISQISPSFTWEFRAPDEMVLYNLSSILGEIEVTLGLTHLPNLTTIKPSQWNSFYELAILDVKAFLYNTIKHYDDLSSAYATIQLKINDWEEAASQRKELIENMKDNYHLDMPGFLII